MPKPLSAREVFEARLLQEEQARPLEAIDPAFRDAVPSQVVREINRLADERGWSQTDTIVWLLQRGLTLVRQPKVGR